MIAYGCGRVLVHVGMGALVNQCLIIGVLVI